MPRPRYQIAAEDVPVVHRWVHTKWQDPVWPQHDTARSARDQFPREHPTATQLQQWCAQYLHATQWAQLQAVIRAARRDTRQTHTVRLSTRAYTRLHELAVREQLTLSETIERYLSSVRGTPTHNATPPPTTKHPPKQKSIHRATQAASRAAVGAHTQGAAFITSKKGVCYLTIKIGRHNFSLMRLHNYTIDAQDKRDMRRRHPDITFDWKKIARQLAEKREVCRRYRSKRRRPRRPRIPREPFYGVVDPLTRTVYVNDPTNIMGVGALLDRMMADERLQNADVVVESRDGVPDVDGSSYDELGRRW